MLTGHSYPSYPKGQTRSCFSALLQQLAAEGDPSALYGAPYWTTRGTAKQSKAKQPSCGSWPLGQLCSLRKPCWFPLGTVDTPDTLLPMAERCHVHQHLHLRQHLRPSLRGTVPTLQRRVRLPGWRGDGRCTGAESGSRTPSPGCSLWLFIKLNNPLQPAHPAPTQRIIPVIYLLKEAHVTFCILSCFVFFVFLHSTPWSCSLIVCTIKLSHWALPDIIWNTCPPPKTLGSSQPDQTHTPMHTRSVSVLPRLMNSVKLPSSVNQ